MVLSYVTRPSCRRLRITFTSLFLFRSGATSLLFPRLHLRSPSHPSKVTCTTATCVRMVPPDKSDVTTPTTRMARTSNGGNGPLERLCETTLEACEALVPVVSALYQSINNDHGGVKTKADDSVFTIADGLVQHLLVEELLGPILRDERKERMVGEEECEVNLLSEPYMVDGLPIPDEFVAAVNDARSTVIQARERQNYNSLYEKINAFIDPIDGTREFSTGKGEQCSICIGFSDEDGNAIAGVVFRPLSNPPTWAAGAKSEGYVASCLQNENCSREEREGAKGGLLTSNGRISEFISCVMEDLSYERVPSGGAGNKMLLLLENSGTGTVYIQDRGVSRWDTCAAQAVLEAHGGMLCKLNSFMNEPDGAEGAEMYTYLKTTTNLDFVPGLASLTRYNAADGVDLKQRTAVDVNDFKPYSNLCGLLALGPTDNTKESKAAILEGLVGAAKRSPPAYD